MGQEGYHGTKVEVSAEYKRETVVMCNALVSVRQIATEIGIGADVLGSWRRENGRPRDEELALLRGAGSRHEGAGFFCEKRQRSLRKRRNEVSDDPTMPRHFPHPTHVPLFAGLAQRVLRLGDAPAQENARLLGGFVRSMPNMTVWSAVPASGKTCATRASGAGRLGGGAPHGSSRLARRAAAPTLATKPSGDPARGDAHSSRAGLHV